LSIRAHLTFAAFCLLAVPAHAEAQSPTCGFRGTPDALADRPSPLDSVLVRLGGIEAKLCYGRPAAGGRTMVGGEHPFGSPWEMGANEPTTLHLPFPAQVGSVNLPPGSYSLYAIPGETEWTIVVNGNPDRWGVPLNAEVRAADLGSFTVAPESATAYLDRLTFSFRPTGDRAGALVYSWEGITLSIPVARR
jgi:hypothetical protein